MHVAHLVGPAHVDPHRASVIQVMALALVKTRCPFEAIEGCQQRWAHGIDLSKNAGAGSVAGHRHRKRPQVIEMQPSHRAGALKPGPRQLPVVSHAPFERAVDKHQR